MVKFNGVKVSIITRFKLAYKAFMLQPFKIYFPYHYFSDLRTDWGRLDCDNNRRVSKCQNEGKVALANPSIELTYNESEHTYHVCHSCAKKYIGAIHGEEYLWEQSNG